MSRLFSCPLTPNPVLKRILYDGERTDRQEGEWDMQSTLQRTGRSFRSLYEQYLPTVYRIAYTYLKNPYDSEDAVHEAFLKLMKQKKPFESEEHVKAWLIVTVSNVCKDMLRRKSRQDTPLEECRQLAAPPVQENALLETILALPEKYRTAVYLHYYEGYTVKEMAEILDQPQETIKTWLRRSRERLRAQLGENDDD